MNLKRQFGWVWWCLLKRRQRPAWITWCDPVSNKGLTMVHIFRSRYEPVEGKHHDKECTLDQAAHVTADTQ